MAGVKRIEQMNVASAGVFTLPERLSSENNREAERKAARRSRLAQHF